MTVDPRSLTIFPHDHIRDLAHSLRAAASEHYCGDCLTSCWGKDAREEAARELDLLSDRLNKSFRWRRTT